MAERMVRKQVYIRPDQDRLLKRRSSETGLTEAELIRQGIDQVTRSPAEEARVKALEELLSFIEERMKLEVPQTGRQWTRDELYDERLARFSR